MLYIKKKKSHQRHDYIKHSLIRRVINIDVNYTFYTYSAAQLGYYRLARVTNIEV